ncbi:peptide chain release factor N(5)-glutamine methyltransferase [Patiriisocius hiemis]|uniref:Release factor glutamine methyltransferase n=1 Tax=Patiriisocius hiemis TaxID=3075604 RepID=A0ABU2YAF1_9FLAO|nr:peptide chain release factor N(5)-glutamine methyltransferase [Constantimarinum sp. W242]MDT0555168.1 peptide chain release factor N(5)-glutamine methyltransferase [Constantimarinum sp. W242]
MKITNYKKYFVSQLSSRYPTEEILSFFYILAEVFLNKTRFQLSLDTNATLTEIQHQQFENGLQRLKQNEPIQYIVGVTEFYGIPFKVTPATLIPRPETEELVDWILNSEINIQHSELKILDIGTGSGCIAISLAKNLTTASVSAIDFSKEALTIAAGNAKNNKVEVSFHQIDVLATNSLPDKYDIIVSNPPYVRELEKKMMQANVTEYEPSSALFVEDDNPFIFYEKITYLAKKHLTSNGLLYFEINEYLSEELMQLIESIGFSGVICKKDMFGKPRMIRCKLK